MEIHICSITEYDAETRMPTIANPNDKTFYLVPTEDGTSPDLFIEWVYVNGAWEMFGSMKIDLSGYLTDVQINGTSIVSDGVANVPTAGTGRLGAVSVNAEYGTSMANGVIRVVTASSVGIKNGANGWTPIAPNRQHESVFYGLAKAAGDTTQSQSNNAVGNYTDNAKDSIQNMLGITPLIASHESDPFESNHVIGELFIINGKLYRVKTTLTAGEYINEGTNVEVVDIAKVLDDYATKQEIENNINIVEKNSNGSIVSFDDGADNVPLKSLVVDIDPVQDLHGYDSPWVGGGGTNKWDEQWEVGSLTWTGADATGTNKIRSKGYIPVVEGKTYRVVTSNNLQFFYYDSSKAFVSYESSSKANGSTITIPTGCAYLRFYTYGTTYGETYKNDIAVNYPSTVTTYSPYENICHISGWTKVDVEQRGVNLWDEEWENGYYSAAGEFVSNYTQLCTKNKIKVLPNTEYYFREGSRSAETNVGGAICFYDADENPIRRSSQNLGTFTTPSNCHYINVNFGHVYGATYNNDISINYPGTDHDYHPYTGQTTPISWQTEAGTVYGGKLDVLSGKLVVDMAMVDLGTLTWGLDTGQSHRFLAYNQVAAKPTGNYSVAVNAICSTYKKLTQNQLYSNNIGVSIQPMNGKTVYVYDDAYDNATAFKSAMSGVQFCYELAEPIEIQLTPNQVNSLLGVNNIWADTGDTSIEYFSQVDEDLIDYIKANLNSYAKKDLLNDYVDDVQINGSSIVTDGVANVPIASENKLGVLRPYGTFGIGAMSDGRLAIIPAVPDNIKNANNEYRPVTPLRQHQSVFYGLAKASGDTTQSVSSNAVGTYTEDAKSAISDMLNGAVQISGTDPIIVAKSGIRYVCGEVLSLNFTPSVNGICDVMFTSGSTPTVLTLPNTVKMPEWFIIEANMTYEINIADGIYGAVTSWTL